MREGADGKGAGVTDGAMDEKRVLREDCHAMAAATQGELVANKASPLFS